MKIWVDFGPKSNIFTFPIFWPGTLVLRLGALENLKMGQVIHKIGLSKLYAAIYEIFIFCHLYTSDAADE